MDLLSDFLFLLLSIKLSIRILTFVKNKHLLFIKIIEHVSGKLKEISLFKNVLITKSKTSFLMGVFFILLKQTWKLLMYLPSLKMFRQCYSLINTTHLAAFLRENCHNNHFGPLKPRFDPPFLIGF